MTGAGRRTRRSPKSRKRKKREGPIRLKEPVDFDLAVKGLMAIDPGITASIRRRR